MDLDDDELNATRQLLYLKYDYENGDKKMYKMKKEYSDFIKTNRLNRQLSKIVGITEGYMSGIVNNRERRDISKTLAYAVTKAINSDLEIADVFDIFETNQ